jgi:hypothetical protein
MLDLLAWVPIVFLVHQHLAEGIGEIDKEQDNGYTTRLQD